MAGGRGLVCSGASGSCSRHWLTCALISSAYGVHFSVLTEIQMSIFHFLVTV